MFLESEKSREEQNEKKPFPSAGTGCARLRGRALVVHHFSTSPAAALIDPACSRGGRQWAGAVRRATAGNPDPALRHCSAAARSRGIAKFRAGSSRFRKPLLSPVPYAAGGHREIRPQPGRLGHLGRLRESERL